MAYENILREDREGVAFVTVNRPDKLNACSEELLDTLGRLQHELDERDGWRIERWCPHRQADLTRFGEIADGVLTCSLHHWRFDLATGDCLTSDDRHLRCTRVAPT